MLKFAGTRLCVDFVRDYGVLTRALSATPDQRVWLTDATGEFFDISGIVGF